MKNVLLISPSSNSQYTLTAPLGLSYVAGELNDFKVYGFDANVYKYVYHYAENDILDFVKQIIINLNIDYICISILEETLPEAEKYAEICKAGNKICIAGGIYPTLYPDDLSDNFEYIVRGDAEKELNQLLKELSRGNQHPDISGLSYFDSKWRHIGEPAPVTCKNEKIPKREVFDFLNGDYQYQSARVISSRGCVYKCSFCTNRVNSKYQRRDMDCFIREIEYLINEKGIKEILFSDDQFLGTNIREYQQAYDILKRIKPYLISKNVRINFQVRADQWNKSLLEFPSLFSLITEISDTFHDPNEEIHQQIYGEKMHGVGIDIGIESFSDKQLKYFNKLCSAEENIQCLSSLFGHNIDVGVYMILFTPSITIDEIIYEVEEYNRQYLQKGYQSKLLLSNLFKPLIPYKGTAFYDRLIQSKKLVAPRNYRFDDLKTAAFYFIIDQELEYMVNREDFSFDNLYQAIMGFLNFCRNMKIDKNLSNLLRKVVCDGKSNGLKDEIYGLIFNNLD